MAGDFLQRQAATEQEGGTQSWVSSHLTYDNQNSGSLHIFLNSTPLIFHSLLNAQVQSLMVLFVWGRSEGRSGLNRKQAINFFIKF